MDKASFKIVCYAGTWYIEAELHFGDNVEVFQHEETWSSRDEAEDYAACAGIVIDEWGGGDTRHEEVPH